MNGNKWILKRQKKLDLIESSYRKACFRLKLPLSKDRLQIDLQEQEMILYREGEIIRKFVVSTSKNQPSCRMDSFGTPLGLHEIAEKIGHGTRPGMIFRGRLPTGQLFSDVSNPSSNPNLITSRILRLRGLENGLNVGLNCDSFSRFIYIHGTNHEEKIGRPFSGGCILLTNADVIELFDRIPLKTHVWIPGKDDTRQV